MLEPFHAIALHYFGNVLLSSQLNSKPKRKKGHLAASSILLWLLVTNRPFKPPGRKDALRRKDCPRNRKLSLAWQLALSQCTMNNERLRLDNFFGNSFRKDNLKKLNLFHDSKLKTKSVMQNQKLNLILWGVGCMLKILLRHIRLKPVREKYFIIVILLITILKTIIQNVIGSCLLWC